MGLLKLGAVCLDDTKRHANTSQHSALSQWHIALIETQLKAEATDLLAQVNKVDQSDLPDGIKRRQDRLAAMEAAKAKIQARATARR